MRQLDYSLAPTDVPTTLPFEAPNLPPNDVPDFVRELDQKPFISLCVNFRHSVDERNQSYEIPAGKSFVNNRNVNVALVIVRLLLARGYTQEDVKIFVPYKRKYF